MAKELEVEKRKPNRKKATVSRIAKLHYADELKVLRAKIESTENQIRLTYGMEEKSQLQNKLKGLWAEVDFVLDEYNSTKGKK